jgi:tRNA modification GTPase
VFSPADTIVAIATAPVRAGIGVVRISGPRAHAVARAILTVAHDLEPRRATLTHVRATADSPAPSAPDLRGPDLRSRGASAPRTIDEAVATYFPSPPASASSNLPPGFGEASRPRPIDEVVAIYYPAPHSYTAEDVVEIAAHGSVALLREIVRSAIAAGARLAEPGEFTLRAFLNGRLDLVQAEAVADLVDAATPLQARVAFDQLEGTLTRAIGALDRELFDLAASLEASVDFPDEGFHFVAPGETAAALRRVRDGIDGLLRTYARGRVIREGRHIAILGKPNVGKSSLFNRLVGTDRAIVTARPGTTRDMLTETIDLDGIRLGLVDTAGIRTSGDEVELEGVSRARRAAEIADLVILVLDRSRPLDDIDRALLRETASAARITVANKCDLPAAWAAEELPWAWDSGLGTQNAKESATAGETQPEVVSLGPAHASRQNAAPGFGRQQAGPPFGTPPGSRPLRSVLQTDAERLGSRARATRPPAAEEAAGVAVEISLKTGDGVDDLRAAMRAALDAGEPLRDAPIVSNVRHEALLREARQSIARAVANIEAAGELASEELLLADLREARRAFEEITGRRTTEDVLRRIFEKFCVGK